MPSQGPLSAPVADGVRPLALRRRRASGVRRKGSEPSRASGRTRDRGGVGAGHEEADPLAFGRRIDPAEEGSKRRCGAGLGDDPHLLPQGVLGLCRWRHPPRARTSRHGAARSGAPARRCALGPANRRQCRRSAHRRARRRRAPWSASAPAPGSTPTILMRPAYQAAMPAISPPPPTATSSVSRSGAWLSSSRPTLPWPSMVST